MTPTSPATRWWDWRAAGLLLIGLFAVASRLAATHWTEHLQIAYVLSFFGLAAGLALGQSKFRLRSVLFLGLVYGLFVAGWQIGSTVAHKSEWSQRLLTVGDRLAVAGQQFARLEPVQDPLLALILFAILFWVMSWQAGYAITRHADPWQATLPGGLALLVIHTYDYRPAGPQFNSLLWAASIYFVMSLLLLARLNFLRRRRSWQARRVYFSPEVDTDILQATVIATVVVVGLAWAAPLTPNILPPARDVWVAVSRPLTDLRSRFGNMFTSLKASFGVVQDNYSDSLPLGRGNALDDTPIMEVEAPTPAGNVPRYYWRAWVYDSFAAGRWKNTFATVEILSPNAFDVTQPQYAARWTGLFAITPNVPIGIIYTPSHPTWVSRAINATVARDPDGDVDFASMQAAVTVYPDETYQVRASISAATVAQLRSAGAAYPDWIKTHYLQTPELTRRTLALAQEITAPYDNAYDKADAITKWLRGNINYVETVPVTPANRETLDWFLFELKEGFCNYYATAEVILLRSLGIPARMAVGYARGEPNIPEDALRPGSLRPGEGPGGFAERLTYTVRQRDAHAWPEVYFPQYGWVEFEPTVSQAPITRALGGPASGDSGDITPTPSPTLASGTPTPIPEIEPDNPQAGAISGALLTFAIWLAAAGGILALGFAGWRLGRRLNLPPFPVLAERGLRRVGFTPPQALAAWARVAELAPIERAYQEVNEALKRLATEPGPADTPADRVAQLKHVLPECAAWASNLLIEYHAAAYGSRPGNPTVAVQAGRLIRNRSWRRFITLKLNGGPVSETPRRYTSWRTS